MTTPDVPTVATAAPQFRIQVRGNRLMRHRSAALSDRIVWQPPSIIVDLPWWAHRLLAKVKP